MRVFGILLCLIALGLTGYSALTYKAPQIEADIERQTVQALSAVDDNDDVRVRVDGRHVMLSGDVAEDDRKRLLLDAAAGVPGALGPVDALTSPTIVSPYLFEAAKREDGQVTVSGMAPDEQAKTLIATEAKALFGENAALTIDIARGAPSKHWPMAAISSMDALAMLRRGRVSIDDLSVLLEGDVPSDVGVEAIDLFAETLPEGFTWAHDVDVHRERIRPFTFSVVKGPDGDLRLNGFAPDEATRDRLIEQGKAVSGDQPLVADIQIADGMPDEEWPALVLAGIGAMKDMQAGRYDVVDNEVSFESDQRAAEGEALSGEPAADVAREDAPIAAEAAPADEGALAALEDGPLDAAIAPMAAEVADRGPVLEVDKVDSGVWLMRGTLPDQGTRDLLVDLVRDHAEADEVETEIALSGDDPDGDWLQFAADRIQSLDEVLAGRLRLEDDDAHLIGVVEFPEDIEPRKTTIAEIDPAMTVDLQPVDPRPIASLNLALSPEEGTVLTGTLPEKLTEDEALRALGIRQHDGGLEEGGRGQAESWRRDLAELGAFLPAFEQVDVSLGGERPRIEGQVHAQSDVEAITDDLVLALGADREPLVDVRATTATYEDGATRTGPLSGLDEIYRRGYWVPVIDIEANATACTERAETMQASDKITFGRGEEGLDHRALAILNGLAGLAIACLEQTDLVLEIGGHTDSRGRASMNRKLSQTRADAVRDALAARGVDEEALIAVGYSDQRPIADNATGEGRAANRRITLEWKRSADSQS